MIMVSDTHPIHCVSTPDQCLFSWWQRVVHTWQRQLSAHWHTIPQLLLSFVTHVNQAMTSCLFCPSPGLRYPHQQLQAGGLLLPRPGWACLPLLLSCTGLQEPPCLLLQPRHLLLSGALLPGLQQPRCLQLSQGSLQQPDWEALLSLQLQLESLVV